MKKNWKFIKLVVSFLLIFLFISYFGVESQNMAINKDTQLFLKLYLDNTQKYLFTVTLFLCMTVPIIHVPFLVPELKARLRKNVFEYVWRKNIAFVLVFSAFILLSFGVVSIYYGYSNVISAFDPTLFFRLFSFILSFIVMYTVVYLRTGKYYLGISLASAANFLFLILLRSLNYSIKVDSISDGTLMLIFTIYVWMINLLGLIYLYMNMDRKEDIL